MSKLNSYELDNSVIHVTGSEGTTTDALEAILNVVDVCSKDPLAADLAKMLMPGDFYNNLYTFAYKTAYFEANPPRHQRIRTLRRTLHDRRASCVDYSILIGSILLAAGEPVDLRLVSVGGKVYDHIYPVTQDGTIMDCVYGQDETGSEFFTRPVNSTGRFNQECKSFQVKHNFLYPMKTDILNGTSTISGTSTINCDRPTGTRGTAAGTKCIACNGTWIPDTINGVELFDIDELNDDDSINGTGSGVTDDEYTSYVMANLVGDHDAMTGNINGLFKKIRAKIADVIPGGKTGDQIMQAVQDKKDAKATKKTDRKANKGKRKENWQNFTGTMLDLVKSKTSQTNAQTEGMLKDLENRGIQPNPEILADLIADENGIDGNSTPKESSNMPLLIGGAALAALLLMKK